MLWAVIMAGGSGTRFWPASRRTSPKQFLKIFGKTSLFEQVLSRVQPMISRSHTLVITQHFNVSTAQKLSRLPKSQIYGEPMGRNTAPCAIFAAMLAYHQDKEAVITLLPADQRIGKPKVFQQALKAAHEAALESGVPVTFGVKPDRPHTGYGYLELGNKQTHRKGFDIFKLKRFCEKPNLSTAIRFVASGRYLWNSGIFVWRAENLLAIAKEHLPEAYHLAFQMVHQPKKYSFMKTFPKMPNISIDYGLMEKLKGSILTIPVEFEWSDLGSWTSCAELWRRDQDANAYDGSVLFHRSAKNIVQSKQKMTVLLGVKDFIVVDTPDVLLVCPKEQAESLREVVQKLHEQKLTQYL